MTLYSLYWKNLNLDNFNYVIKKIEEDLLLDDLIRKLLVADPNKRITWNEYFEHPFFKQFEY